MQTGGPGPCPPHPALRRACASSSLMVAPRLLLAVYSPPLLLAPVTRLLFSFQWLFGALAPCRVTGHSLAISHTLTGALCAKGPRLLVPSRRSLPQHFASPQSGQPGPTLGHLQNAACRRHRPGSAKEGTVPRQDGPRQPQRRRTAAAPAPHFVPSGRWRSRTYRRLAQLGGDVGDGVAVLLQHLAHRDVGPFWGDVEHQHHPGGQPCGSGAPEASAGTAALLCPPSPPRVTVTPRSPPGPAPPRGSLAHGASLREPPGERSPFGRHHVTLLHPRLRSTTRCSPARSSSRCFTHPRR